MLAINNKKLWFFVLLLALLSLLSIVFRLNSPMPYYFALVVPSSGKNESYGEVIHYALSAYLEEINNKGGIAGRPVALKLFDEPLDPAAIEPLARTIAEDKSILLVLGHRYSDNALAAGSVYREAQLPAITATASDNAITRSNPWFFMLGPNNDFEGAFTANYLHQIFPGKSIGVIYSADAYGSSLFEQFKHKSDKLRLNVPYQRRITLEEGDYDENLSRLAADFNTREQPDILYLATQLSESARLLSLIQSANDKLTIICSSACASSQFIENMNHYPRERSQPGYYSDDVYVMSPFILDIANERAQKFHQRLKLNLPTDSQIAPVAYYYDAAQVAIAALRHVAASASGTDLVVTRAKLRDALFQYYDREHGVMGVTGPIYFDPEGNSNKPLVVGIYKNQQLISAPIQYQRVENNQQLSVSQLLDDLWSGQVFFIGDDLLRRTQVIYTGVMVNAIEEIDSTRSQYSLEFYVWFRFDGDFNDSDIEFENVVRSPSLANPLVNENHGGITTRAYQANGMFKGDFRFVDYPFDQQLLAIRFKHKTAQADRLLYVNDIIGSNRFANSDSTEQKALISEAEWLVQRIISFQDRTANQSSIGTLNQLQNVFYSRFNTLIEVNRAGWTVLFKNLFPILLLAILAYLAYFMSASKEQARIGLGSSALVTTAFFHMKFITTMAVDYLMVIEYCFLAVYVLATLVIFISMTNGYYDSLASKYADAEGKEELVNYYRRRIKRLDLFGRFFHPTLIIALIGFFIQRYSIVQNVFLAN